MEIEPLINEFALWLERNEGRSPQTANKYAGNVRNLGLYMAEQQLEVTGLTTEHLETFTGDYMHRKGLKPSSRRAVVASIKKFTAWLRRRKVISKDPSRNLTYPAAGKPLPVPIEREHFEKLLMAPGLQTFSGRRDTAMLALMGGCGLRISGITALNESDLIFYTHEDQEHLAIRVTEKGNKERIVPAPPDCWALIRAYLGSDELEGIDRTLEDGDQVLFVSVRNRRVPPHKYHGENRRLSRGSLWKMVQKYGESCGIPTKQLHPHAMRHMYGTQLIEQDVDLRDIQVLMGHVDIKSTTVYTHLARNRLAEIVRKNGPFKGMNTPVSSLLQQLQ